MKKIICIAVVLLFLGCKSATKQGVNGSKQDYILVDAKVKIYNKDGTRSYKDYQPFKTRTLEFLSDLKHQKL